jgi:amino acid adenylation domain-containing protein
MSVQLPTQPARATDLTVPWSVSGRSEALDRDGPLEVPFERFADDWVERPIAERFEWIAARHGDSVAIDDGRRCFTYAALRRAVRCLAWRIDAAVLPGLPVGVLLADGALFPVAALAALAAGRPYVPIDARYPAERNARVMRDAGLAAVVADGTAPALPPGLQPIDIATALGAADEPLPIVAPGAGPACILYTSGSTGEPKGICNEQRAILQRVSQFTNAAHLHPGDRFILLSSPGTIAGLRDTLATLLSGASLYVADPHAVGVRGVMETLRQHGITVCYAVPALLRQLLAMPAARPAFAHLRLLRLGGDIVLASDLALCRAVLPRQCHVMIGFGSTEVPTVFQWFAPTSWREDGVRLPVGCPVPGVDFAVLGDDGTAVAAGETGELIVRSRYLALGHWRDGRVDPGPLRADPGDPSCRIMRMGDLVRQRPDGLWELVGRTDRQVKIRGLRADPGEVEAALRRSPAVLDAAVVTRKSGSEVTALVAYVVPRTGADEALAGTLRGLVAASVPPHMRLAAIRFIDAIPQLPGFKPDFARLEELDRAESDRQATVTRASVAAPAGDIPPAIRRAVERAWTAVLDRRSLLADRPWDEAGGDSLKALQLWFHIEEQLGRRLALDALDERTPPRRLMAALAAALGPGAARPARASGDTTVPLVFLMPGMMGDDPSLVRFRAGFDGAVRFKLVDYPDWRETMDSGVDFGAIVDRVVAAIVAEGDGQPYRLAGYSYGGFVAYAAAQCLVERGYRVGFLGLLDSRRSGPEDSRELGHYLRLLRAPRRWPMAALRSALVRLPRCRLLRALVERLMRQPSLAAFSFHWRLIEELRVRALRRWHPTPLDVPVTLFLSDERVSDSPADYGWGGLCRSLIVVKIGGTHTSMLEPPLRDRLRAEFLHAQGLADDAPGAATTAVAPPEVG